MTTRKKTARSMLRVTQVRSRIGNQERVVRVLTDGLGLGRIGASVVLPDNPYTRGMIAKVAHIVKFEEVAPAGESSLPASEGGPGAHPSRAVGGGGEGTPRER